MKQHWKNTTKNGLVQHFRYFISLTELHTKDLSVQCGREEGSDLIELLLIVPTSNHDAD